jgi:hypothetical protein
MAKRLKMEDDRGHRWTTWFLWKEGIKLSDIHCWLSAVFGEQAPAQAAVHSGIAATLRTDYIKLSTNSHIDSSVV